MEVEAGHHDQAGLPFSVGPEGHGHGAGLYLEVQGVRDHGVGHAREADLEDPYLVDPCPVGLYPVDLYPVGLLAAKNGKNGLETKKC